MAVTWLIVAACCLLAGAALLLVDRRRRRGGPTPDPDPPVEPEGPVDLFTPNVPPRGPDH
jgi:hypothetical protein